jgi:hypothetical protein
MLIVAAVYKAEQAFLKERDANKLLREKVSKLQGKLDLQSTSGRTSVLQGTCSEADVDPSIIARTPPTVPKQPRPQSVYTYVVGLEEERKKQDGRNTNFKSNKLVVDDHMGQLLDDLDSEIPASRPAYTATTSGAQNTKSNGGSTLGSAFKVHVQAQASGRSFLGQATSGASSLIKKSGFMSNDPDNGGKFIRRG